MWRNILAVLAGILSGSLVIGLVETLGHQIIPPPPGMDASNLESMKAGMAQFRPINFLPVLLAWALGSFTGGALATFLAKTKEPTYALAVGAFILLSGLATLLMLPHPAWFWIVALALPIPAAWLGAQVIAKWTLRKS